MIHPIKRSVQGEIKSTRITICRKAKYIRLRSCHLSRNSLGGHLHQLVLIWLLGISLKFNSTGFRAGLGPNAQSSTWLRPQLSRSIRGLSKQTHVCTICKPSWFYQHIWLAGEYLDCDGYRLWLLCLVGLQGHFQKPGLWMPEIPFIYLNLMDKY